MDRESIKQQQEFIHKHHTASGKSTHNHPKYRVRVLCSRFVFPRSGSWQQRSDMLTTCVCCVTEGEALAPRKDWQDSRCLLRRITGCRSAPRCPSRTAALPGWGVGRRWRR
jgi:hypothetical protein